MLTSREKLDNLEEKIEAAPYEDGEKQELIGKLKDAKQKVDSKLMAAGVSLPKPKIPPLLYVMGGAILLLLLLAQKEDAK